MPSVQQQEIQHGGRSLWFGFLAGPVVYSVHFLTVYLLVEVACRADLLRFGVFGIDGLAFTVLVVTLVAAVINAYVGFLTWRNWQQRQQAEGGDEGGYAPFMGLVGFWLNGLFTATILVTGVPAIFLQPCGWV